jgi:hypothetical protein
LLLDGPKVDPVTGGNSRTELTSRGLNAAAFGFDSRMKGYERDLNIFAQPRKLCPKVADWSSEVT